MLPCDWSVGYIRGVNKIRADDPVEDWGLESVPLTQTSTVTFIDLNVLAIRNSSPGLQEGVWIQQG